MTTLGQFICKSTMAQWLPLINRRSLLTHIRLMSSHTGLQLFQMQSQLLSGRTDTLLDSTHLSLSPTNNSPAARVQRIL
ncbi:hypothetical protein C488_21032 [Natrinema pellirubrum DSM 15624]|uniref:Uncharacterized protein n=1 Tax=Natrinema pellirubrum (strain DSM 15624 / CIP 106293 / JCM 10476 / NCIMB 786 / 157) TaxID=797303 RepID=L9Y3Z3_NATP1|nr:hypothetical protein C488_21032 [Natrinema pellirubrum DSM 15624]